MQSALRDAQILVVCTANLCRSPLMEHLVREALVAADVDGSWHIRSAGTNARDGQRMHARAEAALRERGVPVLAGWKTRFLTVGDIEESDLVLTAGAEQRRIIVDLVPSSTKHVFVFEQFAALLAVSHDRGEARPGVTSLTMAAARARSRLPSADEAAFDLADPARHSMRKFRKCAEVINSASQTIVTESIRLGGSGVGVIPAPDLPVHRQG